MITVKSEVNGQTREQSFDADEFLVSDGFLNLRKNASVLATFAPGHWASVEKEDVPLVRDPAAAIVAIADLIEKQIASLPPHKQKAARRKLHTLAERVAKRGRRR